MYEILRLLMTYLSTVLILTSLSLFCPEKVPVKAKPAYLGTMETLNLPRGPILSMLEGSSLLKRFSAWSANETLKSQQEDTLLLSTSKPQLPKPRPSSEWTGRTAELDCVSQMVWGEARNQPYAGKVATAASAINRAKSGLYSRNLCTVVRSPGQYAGYWGAPKPVRNAAWAPIYQAVVTASYHRDKLPAAYRQVMFFSTGKSDFHNNKETVLAIGDHVYVK